MSEFTAQRATFFKALFGPTSSGYVCIGLIPPGTKGLHEKYFSWPDQLNEMLEYIDAHCEDHNAYYCAQLLDDINFRNDAGKGPRVKENIRVATAAWCDLDACKPQNLLVRPTLTIETSPERYQALWVFEESQDAESAEELSKRIAYYHAKDGADRGGWGLTKLLRVPFTPNFKYVEGTRTSIADVHRAKYRLTDFDIYPVTIKREGIGIPMPPPEEIPELDPLQFIQDRRRRMNPKAFRLYNEVPDSKSWSEPLWELLMLLFEGGATREEVYAVAITAACNKYARDGRPEALWDDVCRAYVKHQEDIQTVVIPEFAQVELLTPEEMTRVRQRTTFVERYITWASGLGDAAPQYHQAGAFVTLSAILAGRVVLPTSFGNINPNLWFMVLGDTTLTRKSTAMDVSIDLLIELDPDVVMATDGSIEGLLQGLSTRPGRPSIFLRDEFAGLLESMTKKDYMAGMAEMFTKLYDGKFQKRLLRRDPVEIRDPILILFTGGIKNRIQQLLSLDHVSSGFMPRFIFLTAKSDVKTLRPMGPPIVRDQKERERILRELTEMFNHYTQMDREIPTQGGIQLPKPRKWRAELSSAAWDRYNKFEFAMLDAGVKSERPELLTPVYDRLSKSALKAAVLIAASEQRTEAVIEVEEIDILQAILYATKWREFAVDVINGVGKTSSERDIERVFENIKRVPGISRSALMRNFHLTARNADSIFQTLEQRGSVTKNTVGKGTMYYPTGNEEV